MSLKGVGKGHKKDLKETDASWEEIRGAILELVEERYEKEEEAHLPASGRLVLLLVVAVIVARGHKRLNCVFQNEQ